MTQCLRCVERTARKQHTCDYCGGIIKKGEKYNYSAYKDDIFFDWKAHKRCDFVALELWDLVDPDLGMTADDFDEACGEFCHVFVCPDCPQFDKEYKECNDDRGFCFDKIHALLQTHRLVKIRDNCRMFRFKVVQRDREIK